MKTNVVRRRLIKDSKSILRGQIIRKGIEFEYAYKTLDCMKERMITDCWFWKRSGY